MCTIHYTVLQHVHYIRTLPYFRVYEIYFNFYATYVREHIYIINDLYFLVLHVPLLYEKPHDYTNKNSVYVVWSVIWFIVFRTYAWNARECCT